MTEDFRLKKPFTEMEKTVGGDSLEEEVRKSHVKSEASNRRCRVGSWIFESAAPTRAPG